MAHQPILIEKEIPNHIISHLKSEYLFLTQHIEALITFLRQACSCQADVFLMPEPSVKDIGKDEMLCTFEHVTGDEALDIAFSHLLDHKIKKADQPGLMSKRLPGTIRVSTNETNELIGRIKKINAIKDALTQYIRDYSPSEDEQFELTKEAIPMAIRKSIGRHLYVIPPNEVKRIGFSLSNRTSMSKAEPRQYWLEKLERTRKNMRSHIDVDGWMKLLDIEEAALNSLSPSTYLRIERPLRKTPIANITYHDRDRPKRTLSAHTPFFIINDDVTISPPRKYQGSATGKAKKKREAVISRLHLYAIKKQP